MKREEQKGKDFKTLYLIFGSSGLKKVECPGFWKVWEDKEEKVALDSDFILFRQVALVLAGQVLRGI